MSHQKPSGDGTQNNGGAVFYSSSVANSTATVNSIFGAVDEKAEIRENTLAALNNTLALLKSNSKTAEELQRTLKQFTNLESQVYSSRQNVLKLSNQTSALLEQEQHVYDSVKAISSSSEQLRLTFMVKNPPAPNSAGLYTPE